MFKIDEFQNIDYDSQPIVCLNYFADGEFFKSRSHRKYFLNVNQICFIHHLTSFYSRNISQFSKEKLYGFSILNISSQQLIIIPIVIENEQLKENDYFSSFLNSEKEKIQNQTVLEFSLYLIMPNSSLIEFNFNQKNQFEDCSIEKIKEFFYQEMDNYLLFINSF